MEAKLKHLEFLQGVISRMATNQFLFKGWAITIAAGLSAFAAVDSRRALLVIALASTMLFWALDGYYLWLERCFRDRYKEVAETDDDKIDFKMVPSKACFFGRWLKASVRPHIVFFYLTIVGVDVVGIFLIKGTLK